MCQNWVFEKKILIVQKNHFFERFCIRFGFYGHVIIAGLGRLKNLLDELILKNSAEFDIKNDLNLLKNLRITFKSCSFKRCIIYRQNLKMDQQILFYKKTNECF